MNIGVSHDLLIVFSKNNVLQQLSQGNIVNRIIHHSGKKIIITGSISQYHRYSVVFGNVIVPASEYSGEIIPLDSLNHHQQVSIGKRERGYTGRLIRYKSIPYVVCESIEFHIDEKLSSGKQLTLFKL